MTPRQIKAIINSVTNDSMTRMEAYKATKKEVDITWQAFKRHYTLNLLEKQKKLHKVKKSS